MKNMTKGGFRCRGENRVFGTARVGDRGQIVIPQAARRFFGISPGDTLLILGNEASGLVISKPEALRHLADEILGKLEASDPDET